ncbi:DUF6090 family protein [Robiginitalea sp. IMCC44478]|uniref:DUF6090 family protein n=1 Tax=Robiginitalea sp. IMCC44478 TaxID=3459122 RepID=UPI0040437F7B
MLRFFRQIRQRLLTDNKFSKYLLYAIGEILLVVIGILIALQVNNWNENKKDIQKSRVLLQEFKKDLASDTTGINRVVSLLERQTNFEAWALQKLAYKMDQIDSLKEVFFGPVYQEFVQDRTYRKLQVSQNPNLTGFLDLQSALTEYYTDTKFLLDYNNQEEERFFIEHNTPKVLWQEMEINMANFPKLSSESEQVKTLLDYAQSIEGRNFIKSNYSRRTSMIRYFLKVKQEAIQLIELINTGLEKDYSG